MRVVGNLMETSLEHIVPHDKLKSDKIKCGDFKCVDKIDKPVKNGYQCLREQNKICSGDSRHTAAGSEYIAAAKQKMSYSTENTSCEVESEIPDISELIVNIIAEKVKEEHISQNMHKIRVQKSVTDKLPEIGPRRGQ
jgi:hypothetical protein